MLYCDVLPSPLRLYPPTRLCQDENLLVSQLCRLSNKKKKADETSKKIIKGKYCWLSLVIIDKKQNLKLKLSIF